MDINDLSNIDLPDPPQLSQGYVLPLNPHLREYQDSENLKRSAENLEDISYEIAYLREESERLNEEVVKLREELSEERKRAETEEKNNKRLAFLLSVLGGILGIVFDKIRDIACSFW